MRLWTIHPTSDLEAQMLMALSSTTMKFQRHHDAEQGQAALLRLTGSIDERTTGLSQTGADLVNMQMEALRDVLRTVQRDAVEDAMRVVERAINEWADGLCPNWETAPLSDLDRAEARAIRIREAFADVRSAIG